MFILGAGSGLFIKCKDNYRVPPGTVIAIMPGLVYLKEFIDKELVAELLPDDNMMVTMR